MKQGTIWCTKQIYIQKVSYDMKRNSTNEKMWYDMICTHHRKIGMIRYDNQQKPKIRYVCVVLIQKKKKNVHTRWHPTQQTNIEYAMVR